VLLVDDCAAAAAGGGGSFVSVLCCWLVDDSAAGVQPEQGHAGHPAGKGSRLLLTVLLQLLCERER
jgi:hypothetical protein